MFDVDPEKQLLDELTEKIIGAAISVQLSQLRVPFERQVALPVRYKSVKLECGYRMDVVVEHKVVLEIKAVERLISVHDAQLLSYLKLAGLRVGLLMNFHVPVLKNGLK